ncbi:hypothetical protein L207DRAFT_641994 [Hyaloscypha variabilis F]|uniref:Uncharacterized protein n=1 Tax=Hyaloscypha variabilis (strain UAMH 11265 / GT02V1 / F) TaxID=1149755 RepID=A0A2J6QUF0_HYAVF|nr:hypothetical protein L207DRAFT_641994 [Hyaloscypha variabilis F]
MRLVFLMTCIKQYCVGYGVFQHCYDCHDVTTFWRELGLNLMFITTIMKALFSFSCSTKRDGLDVLLMCGMLLWWLGGLMLFIHKIPIESCISQTMISVFVIPSKRPAANPKHELQQLLHSAIISTVTGEVAQKVSNYIFEVSDKSKTRDAGRSRAKVVGAEWVLKWRRTSRSLSRATQHPGHGALPRSTKKLCLSTADPATVPTSLCLPSTVSMQSADSRTARSSSAKFVSSTRHASVDRRFSFDLASSPNADTITRPGDRFSKCSLFLPDAPRYNSVPILVESIKLPNQKVKKHRVRQAESPTWHKPATLQGPPTAQRNVGQPQIVSGAAISVPGISTNPTAGAHVLGTRVVGTIAESPRSTGTKDQKH